MAIVTNYEPLKPIETPARFGPGEPHTFRVLQGPAAAEMADLTSLVDDLLFCRSALEAFTSAMDDGAAGVRPIPVHLRCLWFSAVVAYARCFNRSARQRIDPEIFEVFPADQEWPKSHEMVMTIRDKLIAHRVSAAETYTSGVYVRPDGEVIGVGFAFSNRYMPSRDLAKRLHEHAGIAYSAVVVRMHEVEPRLLEQARSMLSKDRLALPVIADPGAMSETEATALLHRRVAYSVRPPVGLNAHAKAALAEKRAGRGAGTPNAPLRERR